MLPSIQYILNNVTTSHLCNPKYLQIDQYNKRNVWSASLDSATGHALELLTNYFSHYVNPEHISAFDIWNAWKSFNSFALGNF